MKTIEEVQDEYKNNLSIPSIKPTVQCLVCPVGLIGSGKTTVITPIASELNLVRVSNDEYRILLKQNGHNYETVKSFIRTTCTNLLEQGHSIALDANCGGQTTYSFIKKAEEIYRVKVFWLHINTPEEYALEGLRLRQSPMVETNEDWIRNRENQKERIEHLGYEFDFFATFDISRTDFEAQITNCIEQLKQKIYQ